MIIIRQILKKYNYNKYNIFKIIIYYLLIILNILLYINNFKYLYYVTINGYTINSVITKMIIFDIMSEINNIERIFPIIFYLMITLNIIICIINIVKYTNKMKEKV